MTEPRFGAAFELAFWHIVIGLLHGAAVTLSIGLSDAIELSTNPRVHEEHNCPDVMLMRWQDYTHWHAFLSGIKARWQPIMLLLLVAPSNSLAIGFLCLANVLVPIAAIPQQDADMLFGHRMLYILNPVMLVVAVTLGLLGI